MSQTHPDERKRAVRIGKARADLMYQVRRAENQLQEVGKVNSEILAKIEKARAILSHIRKGKEF